MTNTASHRCVIDVLYLRCFAKPHDYGSGSDEDTDDDSDTRNRYRLTLNCYDLDRIEQIYANLRPFVQSGAISEAEAKQDLSHEIDSKPFTDPSKLSDQMLTLLAVFNKPYRTLATLLMGLHSVNIRSSKGSTYRMRFVAPGAAHSTGGSASTKATSAAYPLLFGSSLLVGKFRDLYGHQNDADLDKEFKDLLEAELDALDRLTTSDSSSATDTDWGRSVQKRLAPFVDPHRTREGCRIENNTYTCFSSHGENIIYSQQKHPSHLREELEYSETSSD